ncbi:MAG: radical SAM family heme chaperone HemW [Chlamydiia bacterium]|nr:radical SAM family heme chaperone HemW [Chlamydiia bacterium]
MKSSKTTLMKNPTSAKKIAGDEAVLSIPTPTNGNALGLYIHIPFCRKKCDYCHFYVLPDKKNLVESYFQALLKELSSAKEKIETQQTLVSIYLGGGTPPLLGIERLEILLRKIFIQFPCSSKLEVTIEANPEFLTAEFLRQSLAIGINRLSLGVQSFNQEHLHTLSRTHTSKQCSESVMLAKAIGFNNISVDLMFDIPHQTYESWQQTLSTACELPITHLSLYNLTIEPHTVFYKKRHSLAAAQMSEEISKSCYELAQHYLKEKQFTQYEISAFCRNGAYSVHNTGYWEGRSFLGLGPSAFSDWNGTRYRNICHLGRYCRALMEGLSPVDFSETLLAEPRQRERLVVALRLFKGVDLEQFQRTFGPFSSTLNESIHELIQHHLLEVIDGKILRLTERGVFLYDSIAVELIE